MKKSSAIIRMLEQGKTYTDIQLKLRVSPSRISILKKQLKNPPADNAPSANTTTTTTTEHKPLSVSEILELGKCAKFAIPKASMPPKGALLPTTSVGKCCICSREIFAVDLVYMDEEVGVNSYACSRECCIKYYRIRYNAIPGFE